MRCWLSGVSGSSCSVLYIKICSFLVQMQLQSPEIALQDRSIQMMVETLNSSVWRLSSSCFYLDPTSGSWGFKPFKTEDDIYDSWPVFLGNYSHEEIFVTHLRTGWVAWCAIAVPTRASLFLLKIGSYTNCSSVKSLSSRVTQTIKIAMGYWALWTVSAMKNELLSADVLPLMSLLGKNSLDRTPGDTKSITSQKYMRGSCSSIV